jgi:hypothetical protein
MATNLKEPDPFVKNQIADLSIDDSRPLIITDADEVLFQFMAGLEEYIIGRGLMFDWSSFALTGNIRDAKSGEALEPADVKTFLAEFFAERTADLVPVDGAAEALKRLSARARIVVLSNVPEAAIADRVSCLAQHGMPYPLIANVGPKGPAVRALLASRDRPAVFIDDIPHNHKSVADHSANVLRLHFIAHPRLGAMLGPAEYSDRRLSSWTEIESTIGEHFANAGY